MTEQAISNAEPGIAGQMPNVLVVLTDDQGWGDLSIHGNLNLSTPHLDSLARDGAAFDRFYVCPVCAPTRAELLTGRYCQRVGVHSVTGGGERLNLDEKTIGDTFKAAGYVTGAFGKWHNGLQWPYHPNARGFDEFYGFCSGHWGHYFAPDLEHNGERVKGRGYIADDLTERAMAFIEQHRNRPFFCYLPYNTPHAPMQVPDRFYKKFDGADLEMRHRDPEKEDLQHTRAALAMCENIDWNVGRVLSRLQELDLADKTIVLYFSDNGPNGWRWNGGMRGRKGSTDEGGIRVPCFARWPGHIAPGTTIPRIAGAIDLLPTLADMAGIPVASDKPLDGVSLKPLLLGTPSHWPERIICSHWAGEVSARDQQHRLDHAGRLYDIVADPRQDYDVAGDRPEAAARLSQAATDRRQELQALGRDNRPFPVGYIERRTTYLPARDGIPHGGVRRSSQHPNCSFFTNWASTEDRMTWDIEVATAGRYEAAIYYTCGEEDVGSTVELSFGDSRVMAKVTESHDPPLVGRAHDRAERTESCVKDFKRMTLGGLTLDGTRGELTLRASEIPGRQAMDVRYVCLTLIAERSVSRTGAHRVCPE